MRWFILAALLLSGCGSPRSWEGTDAGDAFGSGYWGAIANQVHERMQ